MLSTFFVTLLTILGLGGRAAFAAPSQSRRATSDGPDGCSQTVFKAALPSYASISDVYFSGKLDSPQPNYRIVLNSIPPELMSKICAVTVAVKLPDSTNTFNFEVWLPPLNKWNQRFLTVGNYAFDGGISRVDMAGRVIHGFAMMSTDTGHPEPNLLSPTKMDWALTKPNKALGIDRQRDWSYRAMNHSVPLAKSLINAFYSSQKANHTIRTSFYSGCSTGGRQGLRQIQLAADSFDGLLIGAPAWDLKSMMPALSRIAEYNLPESKPADQKLDDIYKFQIIADVVMDACDLIPGFDDANDTMISAPSKCAEHLAVNPAVWQRKLCRTGQNSSTCLTKPQIDIVMSMVKEISTGAGFLFDGFDISAASDLSTYLLKYPPWAFNAATGFDQEFAKYFLLQDDTASLATTRWGNNGERLVSLASDWNNKIPATADQFQLSGQFKGKMIMYHGLADGLIPSNSSTRYYRNTQQFYESDISSWFRYFRVPGMQHCFNSAAEMATTVAPWYFGGPGIAGAGNRTTTFVADARFNNSDHDALLALVDWVEQTRPVDKLIAAAFQPGSWDDKTFQVKRQRPICPHPQMPKWDGKPGTENKLENWSCA